VTLIHRLPFALLIWRLALDIPYRISATGLIIARTVLGIAAGFLIPLSLSVLPVVFTEEERPRAVGMWAAANFVALPIGPILGGWLLTHYRWGSVFLINVPVAMLGVIAVAVLLPESRSAERPGFDPVGVVTSSAGLTGLIYSVIAAGEHGWGDARTLVPLIAGAVLLVVFVLWEHWLSQRPNGEPLVDLGLFRSASFTWGTILGGLGIFAMFGVLFAMPQYAQAILGTDPQGTGRRLLPLIGGLALGAGLADRVAARIGVKITVSLGFAVTAIGLIAGGTTTVTSGDTFLAVWTAVCGAGAGLALATAANAALGALSADRSGVGSALMQAVQKTGIPFGASILGSLLNSGYRNHLNLADLPAQSAEAVRKSVFAGIAVAQQLGSAQLLDSVRRAFVDGMDLAVWVCAGIAVVSLLLTLAFLPQRSGAVQEKKEGATADEVVTLGR
jgi:DHA2 family multidrug resistance protein-like MFS transporter